MTIILAVIVNLFSVSRTIMTIHPKSLLIINILVKRQLTINEQLLENYILNPG